MEKDVENRVAMEVETMRQEVLGSVDTVIRTTGGEGMGFLTASCKQRCSLSVF